MTDIVRGVMAEEGLFTDCVPNMYRIQDVFGTSRCFCARCSRVWTSHMTWVKFDLRSQRILKNWKQLCVVCNTSVNPYINSEELERMAKLAVERCVSLTNGTFVLRTSQRRIPPHNTMACEKCREGGRPCWIIKQKKSPSPCPSESSGSQDSDLDLLSDDLTKMMLASTDTSVVSSRAQSPEEFGPRPITTPYVTPSYGPGLYVAGYYPPAPYATPPPQQAFLPAPPPQVYSNGAVFYQQAPPPFIQAPLLPWQMVQ